MQSCGYTCIRLYSHMKTLKMCNRAVNTSPSAIQFVPQCYKTQEMCDKVVDTCPFIFDFACDWYKTQEICDKVVSKIYLCWAADYFLPSLKFVPDCFVTSKIIKKPHNALFEDDDILFFDGDSGNVTFSNDEIDIISVDLNNINLDDINFDENDLKLLFMSNVWLGIIDLNNAKRLKYI